MPRWTAPARGAREIIASREATTHALALVLPLRRAFCSVASATALVAATTTCEQPPTEPAEGPPAKLAVTVQPSSAQAGAAISASVAVAVQDSAGNVVTTSQASIRLRITDGTGTPRAHLRGVTVVYAEGGVATFPSLNIDSAGTGYALTATATGLDGAVTTVFDISPAPPVRLAFAVQPRDTMAGAPMTPAVTVAVRDSLGNVVPTATPQITLTIGPDPGQGTLAGETTRSAVGGIAVFAGLSVDGSSSHFTLTAMASGLTGATSAAFAIDLSVRAISAGMYHTCAVTTRDAVYCWGLGGSGELGNGSWADSWIPSAVGGGYTSVSAGAHQTCGLTTTGAVYCWGESITGRTRRPVPVTGGLTFSSVSAGGFYGCGLTPGGRAYCWGANYDGRLGNGTEVSSEAPISVAGGLVFASISAGMGGSTCGVTTGGAGYCWGRNEWGTLGDASTSDRLTPVPVAGGLSFSSISPGNTDTCGLTTAGTVFCWGLFWPPTPTPVSGGLTFASISQRCGLMSDGTAYCWGYPGGSGVAVPYLIAGGLTFAAISAGYAHTCGVTPSGAAYCWGENDHGQLGDGTNYYDYTPKRVKLF